MNPQGLAALLYQLAAIQHSFAEADNDPDYAEAVLRLKHRIGLATAVGDIVWIDALDWTAFACEAPA